MSDNENQGKIAKIVEKKFPNIYMIGKSGELEICRKLFKLGFAVIRVPASGRRSKRLTYPDIVAIKNGRVLVFEVKIRETISSIYIRSSQIRKCMGFVKRSGGIALLAIKIKSEGVWKVIEMHKFSSKGFTTDNVLISSEEIRNAENLFDWLKRNGYI